VCANFESIRNGAGKDFRRSEPVNVFGPNLTWQRRNFVECRYSVPGSHMVARSHTVPVPVGGLAAVQQVFGLILRFSTVQ